MEIKALDILFRLLTAHFLADFILQPDSWVKDRQKHQLQSKYFWLHITIVGITTYVLLGDWDNWQAPFIIVITHLLIDVVKILSKKDKKHFRKSEKGIPKLNTIKITSIYHPG